MPTGAGGGGRARAVPDTGRAVYAALDLGTNNRRLLVARAAAGGFRVVDSFSRIVRLGEGLAETGRLGEAGMARTIEALRVCAGKLARHPGVRSRHVATEACRRAANGREFLARAERESGLAFEIISADEEARLAVTGCASLLSGKEPHGVLFDIGGGSTEVAWLACAPGRMPDVVDVISIPAGVADMAARHGGGDLAPAGFEAIAAEVADGLAGFEARHGIGAHVDAGRVQMLGTSGTVTTLAAVHMGLDRYDRSRIDGVHLDTADAWRVADRLLAMSRAERAAHPCVQEVRAEFVLPGTAILAGICRRWPVARLRVADRGLREGILAGLMAEDRAEDRAANRTGAR
jgi:exopolyphosphatase/guanosine-5'-triphosphate,3'-diphosphate pyrophosphatase